VTFVLGDVSNGDTPMLGYYAGVLYQSHSNNSPVTRDPRARYCQRNTIHQHFVTLGDGQIFSRSVQRWMGQQLSLLPPGLLKKVRVDEEAKIMRYGRLLFANRMDCGGPLNVPALGPAALAQMRALRVYPDALHAQKETFKSMTYLADDVAREYTTLANGVREVVSKSKTRAQLTLQTHFRGSSEAFNKSCDDLWGRDFVKIFGQREKIYGPTSSNLFMTTADVMVLANKLVSAGHRTMCKPQKVALRDLVTLVHSIGFRALRALKKPGTREHKHMFQVHNQMYSIAWSPDFVARNHSAQRTELAVHDSRAHINRRGAASKQATLTSHVQNAAVRQAGRRGGVEHRDGDGERDFPTAFPTSMLFHSCVTGFDVRSMREFVVTLDRMLPAAAAFVLADPGTHGVLWVSTPDLAARAGRDPKFFENKVCKQVCFCKSKGAPSHTFAWDDFARQSTLAGYLEEPWCHPVDQVVSLSLPAPPLPHRSP